ncbi:MAG: hypothetical protein ACM3ZB_01660 [bacterium]
MAHGTSLPAGVSLVPPQRAWRARLRTLAVPSLADWLFAALIVWLFVAGAGWETLLADGDTGLHIRAGELILERGLPMTDPFSFTRPGEPWFAWEWLSEVIFAALHAWMGLKGVVLLAGVAISAALALVFRQAIALGANLFPALMTTLLAAGAAGIHFLARPHVFTLLLLPASLWLARTRAAWTLVPLAAVWANLHGGFAALLLSLAVMAAGSAIERNWKEARRLGALAAACAAATFANPYGYRLHVHMWSYLRSGWIREAVDEFQSPRFRSEASLQFEALLFAALLVAASLLRKRRFAGALLLVVWAHAALVSVRHVPVFAIVAAPLVAAEASVLWRGVRHGARSVAGVVRQMGEDLRRGAARTSMLPVLSVAALAFSGAPLRWPAGFPEVKFPVEMAERHAHRLAGARVFTSDQWGDYLLYRFYPRQRVFIDGRSDFYGPEAGRLYLETAYARTGWPETLDRYGISAVLAPREWPLAAALGRESGWRKLDEDRLAVLYVR